MQCYITKCKLVIIKLLTHLYDNMNSNNDVFIDNNNSQNNNIAIVLLALFISWKHFSKYFTELEATRLTILLLYWNIWYKFRPTLNVHVQFLAINLLQMRKSRLEACAAAKSGAKNNCLDFGINVFKNKTLHDFIKAKDLLSDLNILKNQCLESIIAKTIYE